MVFSAALGFRFTAALFLSSLLHRLMLCRLLRSADKSLLTMPRTFHERAQILGFGKAVFRRS